MTKFLIVTKNLREIPAFSVHSSEKGNVVLLRRQHSGPTITDAEFYFQRINASQGESYEHILLNQWYKTKLFSDGSVITIQEWERSESPFIKEKHDYVAEAWEKLRGHKLAASLIFCGTLIAATLPFIKDLKDLISKSSNSESNCKLVASERKRTRWHNFFPNSSDFINTEDKIWYETSHRFVERERTSDFVVLYDVTRDMWIRLLERQVEVKHPGTHGIWMTLANSDQSEMRGCWIE